MIQYLGLLDASGIQDFVFRNPALKEIASASRIVEALSIRPDGLYCQAAGRAGANIILAAGGNAAFWAESEASLQTVFKIVSRELLQMGEGLQIVGAITPYRAGKLGASYSIALRELERRKFTQPRSADFTFAGLESPRPNGPSCYSRTTAFPMGGLVEPLNFAHLICRSQEQTNLAAVVQVDCLSMGRRLSSWLLQAKKLSDDEFCRGFEAWSEHVKACWRDAWQQCLETIDTAFASQGQRTLEHLCLRDCSPQQPRPMTLQSSEYGRSDYLPCRKIYQGGDDLVFVCDARIALVLTVELLRNLEDCPVPDTVPSEFRNLTASAGIVFVEAHFPFSRAVRLAEMTRNRAKRRASEAVSDTPHMTPPSAIDWWVNRQGELERPEPPFPKASCKPYLLHRDSPGQAMLDVAEFEQVIWGLWRTFHSSRNKLKDLLLAASQGERGNAVRRLLQMRPLPNGAQLGFLPHGFDPETGFLGAETLLLDAAELFDIHYPLSMRT